MQSAAILIDTVGQWTDDCYGRRTSLFQDGCGSNGPVSIRHDSIDTDSVACGLYTYQQRQTGIECDTIANTKLSTEQTIHYGNVGHFSICRVSSVSRRCFTYDDSHSTARQYPVLGSRDAVHLPRPQVQFNTDAGRADDRVGRIG
jgi:hypothetical protein